MRLVFVNRYAWPDVAATAQQLGDLAEHLAERGHEVTVLSSAGRYRGMGEPLPREETHRGVRYRRLRSFAHGQAGFLRRGLDYLAFHLQTRGWLRDHAHEIDAVVSLTDPPAIGLHAAKLKGVASVVWCMDILSDAALALGVLKPGSLEARLAAFFERRSLRRADRVVALGRCMAERLEAHGVSPERIEIISVWADGEEIPGHPRGPSPALAELKARLRIAADFVVMYSGNAGRVHDFEALKSAMLALRDETDIAFLFSGGGPRLPELQAFVNEQGLTNAHFRGYFSREELGLALAVADAHLVTLRRGLEGVVVPCKLYGAMAAARPILAMSPGASTVAREVQSTGAGFALLPEDGAGLADAIRRLAREPGLVEEMGTRARAAFERDHEKGVCAARWELLLKALTRPRRH